MPGPIGQGKRRVSPRLIASAATRSVGRGKSGFVEAKVMKNAMIHGRAGGRWRRRFVRGLVVVLGTFLVPQYLAAGPSNDTLYWSTGREISSIVPYYNLNDETRIFERLVWDTLIYRVPNSAVFKPQLATSFKWIGATSIELELRRDVVFHDGSRFSADDVRVTIEHLKRESSKVPSLRPVSWIKNVEQLGRYKLRINLHRPVPHALEFLAGPLPILPQHIWRTAVVGRDGGIDFGTAAPIGTGPYRVARIDPGRSIELERNRRYFAGPKGRPAIGRIVFKSVPDAESRLQQLLDGRQDWIWGLSKHAVDRLVERGAPIRLLGSASMRVAFLAFDGAGRGNPDTPLRDVRVRRALSHAINRAEISKKIFGKPSTVLHAPCFGTQFGCVKSKFTYEFSPEKAKALLRQAGYGVPGETLTRDYVDEKGATKQELIYLEPLRLRLFNYRNRPVANEIKAYLAAVSVELDVEHFPRFESLFPKLRDGGAEMVHFTWGSHGMNDVAAILNPFFRHGTLDSCRDREIKNWLDLAGNTIDRKKRLRFYGNALKRIHDRACVLPLFNYVTFYAHSPRLLSNRRPTICRASIPRAGDNRRADDAAPISKGKIK